VKRRPTKYCFPAIHDSVTDRTFARSITIIGWHNTVRCPKLPIQPHLAFQNQKAWFGLGPPRHGGRWEGKKYLKKSEWRLIAENSLNGDSLLEGSGPIIERWSETCESYDHPFIL